MKKVRIKTEEAEFEGELIGEDVDFYKLENVRIHTPNLSTEVRNVELWIRKSRVLEIEVI
ncbi:MAG: hypothetical protein PWR13_1086 [Archaeoglobi archaeon]|nr:hypothetical protein [Archaeoglobi archaeon]